MRRVIVGAALVAGCTANNPAFDTGGATAAEPTTETSVAASETTASSTATSTTTTDASSDVDTTLPPTDVTGDVEIPDPEPCCGPDDCATNVVECMCEVSPDCCGLEWATPCRDVAIACNGVCDGELRPCCIPHDEVACTGVNLMPFCLLNSSCCLSNWTTQCVVDYDEAYGVCDLGPCDVSRGTPGCDDAEIMDCVCGANPGNPDCCTEAWDEGCVALATKCPA